MDLFSESWMKQFGEAWNNNNDITSRLASINFNSTICYGFTEDVNPTGVIVVEKGRVTLADAYKGEKPSWDLRASREDWKVFMAQPMTVARIGWYYSFGNLKFKTGDYLGMISNPMMAGPFIQSFSVMSSVPTK